MNQDIRKGGSTDSHIRSGDFRQVMKLNKTHFFLSLSRQTHHGMS